MAVHIKGVINRPSAPRNSFTQEKGQDSSSSQEPDHAAWDWGYGTIKDVVGGKYISAIYQGKDFKQSVHIGNKEDPRTLITVGAPGLEEIVHLYGGLQKGLKVRIWHRGKTIEKDGSKMHADVVGGVDDEFSNRVADPKPTVLTTGPYQLFSGGITNLV